MRILRFLAWAVFLLDLVVFTQLVYGLTGGRGGANEEAALRGLATMLGSGLLGIAVVLVVSARFRLTAGFWVALICGALPLLWIITAFFRSVAD
jgi:hypothetical protein